jgi:hypothetical protein
MSQQINPVGVRDVVLDLDDKINYAVYRGPESISIQKYPANSATSSQHVYSIQVPSTSTCVDRNIVWGATFTLTVAGTPAVGEYLVNLSQVNQQAAGGTAVYGGDCFAPFPLNQMAVNVSAQINNTAVSVQTQQILDPLLRAVDKKKFEQWNGATPTQLDVYGNYQQALCQQTVAPAQATTGAPSITQQGLVVSAFNSPFATFEDGNCNNAIVPRGAFRIVSITGNDAGGTVADVLQTRTVLITVAVREPVFLSPFLFNEEIEAPALAGITQINFTCQMDASAIRAFRWVVDDQTVRKQITNVSYAQAECYMEVKYYTPKVSDMIPSTIVTPLSTFTNYQLPGNGLVLGPGASAQLTSNSIMLNSYPDKVFVYIDNARKYRQPSGTLADRWNEFGNGLADHYGTITGVNITLNNRTGILSTFSQEQLYKASVLSGSQQSFAEFSGQQMLWANADSLPVNAAASAFNSTCGSVLMLDFGKIINIPESYFSPGSLSTAQIQIIVDFKNNQQFDIVPQLNLIMMYSGILSTANGSSSSYTSGILTKENVLNSAAVPRPMNSEHLARLVGGGLKGSLKSIATSILPFLKRELLAPAVENLGSQAVSRLSRKLRA